MRIRSFKVKDLSSNAQGMMGINIFSRTKTEISFMICPNNMLYGINENNDYYVGRVDEKFNILLFKVPYIKNPYISVEWFKGKLSEDFKSISGGFWNSYYGDIINFDVHKNIKSIIVTRELFERVQNEHIPDIDILAFQAFNIACLKVKQLPEIVNSVKQSCIVARKVKDTSRKQTYPYTRKKTLYKNNTR